MADVFAAKGDITLDGLIPVISTGTSVNPGELDNILGLEGLAPKIGTGVLIEVPLKTMQFDEGIGDVYVSIGDNIDIPIEDLELTGLGPDIHTGVTITPPTGDIAFMRLADVIPEILARPRNFFAAIHGRSIEEVFILLLTIEHEDLVEPIYVANDVRDDLGGGARGVRSQGKEFVFIPFQAKLPNLEQDVIPAAKLTMDNISREITRVISEISSPPMVRMQIVLSTDPNVVEYDLQGFKLNNVNYDVLTVEGDLTVEYFASEPYPSVRFTPSRFPGLFRGRKTVQQQ